MSIEQNNSTTIIPFCIFHWNNPNTDTYRGYIGDPVKTRQPDGSDLYECKPSAPAYGNWTIYGTFYAVNPMLRPIPTGLKLFSAIKADKFPYNSTQLDFLYDPYNVNKDGVAFMTWSQKVPYTVPLYIYDNGSSIYPSFTKNPFGKNWKESIISPIFVLVDPKMTYLNPKHPETPGKHNVKDVFARNTNNQLIYKFSNKHDGPGNCLPDPTGDSLTTCFLLSDEDLLRQDPTPDIPRPPTLLEHLKDILREKERRLTFFDTISPYFITLILIVFILSIIACIIILLKPSN